MEENLKGILDTFEELKGQFVIASYTKIYRLIAIGEDDMDYYYVLWDGDSVLWTSCLLSIIPLKGKIDDEEYQKMSENWALNDWALPSTFTFFRNPDPEGAAKKNRSEIEAEVKGARFLTEVFWDIV